jgi:uncharacterized membrane protein YgdD (TMEM256/DUF423 family)
MIYNAGKERYELFRKWFALGTLNAGLAVALGAFGSHVLEDRLSADMLSVFETGNRYHFIHALGLLAVALAADKAGGTAAMKWAGRLLLAGIVLFSGSLYVLGLSGMTWLGAIAPLGGVSFIAGWLLAAKGVLSK